MRIEEVWALPLERVNAFFQEQQEVLAYEDGFRFRECQIWLTPLPPRWLAGMALPQIKITLEGPGSSLSIIYKQFHLRFLSAGG